MRRMAILIVVAGFCAAGAGPAAAQLPEVPLPDAPDVPDAELPELPADDGGGGSGGSGGGSSPVPSVETPIGGGGSASGGGGGSGGSDSGGGSGGSDSGGGSGGSDSGGSGGSGSGSRPGGGSGSDSCPCAAPASGYPVAGDYDKCPVEDDGAPGTASGDAEAGLAASRSDGSSGGGTNAPGGVSGAEAFGEDTSQPPTPDGALLGEDSAATNLLSVAVLALAGLGLLVFIAGGVRGWLREQGFR